MTGFFIYFRLIHSKMKLIFRYSSGAVAVCQDSSKLSVLNFGEKGQEMM